MYAALQTTSTLPPSAAHTVKLLMMFVALQTASLPPMPSTSVATIKTVQLLTLSAIDFCRQQNNAIVDFRCLPTSIAVVATDDYHLPNNTVVDVAFCHPHNNIDNDNCFPSNRDAIGHRQNNVVVAVISANNRSKKAINIIIASHFDDVPAVVDRYMVIPHPFIHAAQPLPLPIVSHPISPAPRPISSTPRTPHVQLRRHKKPTLKFRFNKNKSKINNNKPLKLTTQPKQTNYIQPNLDSVFTPSSPTHYHNLTNTSSTSTSSSPRLNTLNTLPLSLSNLSTSNQYTPEISQTHQIIPPFHLPTLDVTTSYSTSSKSQRLSKLI